MAVYATPDDVRSAVARDLSMVTGNAASMDDVELDLAVRNAQAEVDAKLRGRYTVPFTSPIPELVRNIVVDVAAYLSTLLYRQGKDLSAMDPVTLRYVRAEKLLDDIMKGNADLDVGDGGVTGPTTGGALGRPINPYDGALVEMANFGLGYGSPYDSSGRWGY